jgi:AraC-like DNA-binding protein
MDAIWSELFIDTPLILQDHDVIVSAFSRIEGNEYCKTEPASERAVLIFGKNGLWKTQFANGTQSSNAAFSISAHAKPILVTSDNADGCIEVNMPSWVALQILPDCCEADCSASELQEISRHLSQLVDMVYSSNNLAGVGSQIADWIAKLLVQTENKRCRKEIVWAWTQIAKANQAKSVRKLAEEIQWSDRHFSKQFYIATGLEPKLAMRLMRFRNAHFQVNTSQKRLAQIAIDCGYSDQSHMNKEFDEFAGCSPKKARQAAESGVQIKLAVS